MELKPIDQAIDVLNKRLEELIEACERLDDEELIRSMAEESRRIDKINNAPGVNERPLSDYEKVVRIVLKEQVRISYNLVDRLVSPGV